MRRHARRGRTRGRHTRSQLGLAGQDLPPTQHTDCKHSQHDGRAIRQSDFAVIRERRVVWGPARIRASRAEGRQPGMTLGRGEGEREKGGARAQWSRSKPIHTRAQACSLGGTRERRRRENEGEERRGRGTGKRRAGEGRCGLGQTRGREGRGGGTNPGVVDRSLYSTSADPEEGGSQTGRNSSMPISSRQ